MAYRCTFKLDLPWGPKGTKMMYEEAELDRDSFYVYPEGFFNQGFPTPKATFEEFFEIVTKQFVPKKDEVFFSLLPDLGILKKAWADSALDQRYVAVGNCFKTHAQATEAATRVRETFIRFHEELLRPV